MKFAKIPVVIDAEQWAKPEDTGALMRWVNETSTGALTYNPDADGAVGAGGEQWGELRVTTLEGHHVATPGDWLIRGVKGEFYFCKPDVFERTYQPAGEEAA